MSKTSSHKNDQQTHQINTLVEDSFCRRIITISYQQSKDDIVIDYMSMHMGYDTHDFTGQAKPFDPAKTSFDMARLAGSTMLGIIANNDEQPEHFKLSAEELTIVSMAAKAFSRATSTTGSYYSV